MTAAYWSLMTLLGRTIDSSRSRVLNRPATPVRSGPAAPPSLSKRWQAKHFAGGEQRAAAVEVALRFRPVSTIGASSSSVQSLTNGRGGPATAAVARRGGASRIGLSSAFSDSLRVATASSL